MAIAYSGNTGKNFATSGTIVVTVTVNVGDTVIVTVGLNAGGTRTVSAVDSSGVNTYATKSNQANGVGCQSFVLGSLNVSNSATTVTVTVAGGVYTLCDVCVATYTGVGTNGFGNTGVNTGSSTTLTVVATTQDTNNFIVAALTQATGAAPTFTASVGNLRNQQAGGASNGVAINDNTAASATSVTNTVTSNKNAGWACCAVELRSTNSSIFQPDEDFGPSLMLCGSDPIITIWQ